MLLSQAQRRASPPVHLNRQATPILGTRLLWSKRRSIGKAAEILTRENVTQDRIEMQAAQIEQLKKAKQDAERKAAKIKESNSFRLGRVVTYLPRKARKAIRDIQKKTRG